MITWFSLLRTSLDLWCVQKESGIWCKPSLCSHPSQPHRHQYAPLIWLCFEEILNSVPHSITTVHAHILACPDDSWSNSRPSHQARYHPELCSESCDQFVGFRTDNGCPGLPRGYQRVIAVYQSHQGSGFSSKTLGVWTAGHQLAFCPAGVNPASSPADLLSRYSGSSHFSLRTCQLPVPKPTLSSSGS